ncbi:MAG: hypothetical protein ACNS60_13980 [Candidatus Cyclobacteriaceae bacterium M2_1C_046]
MIVSKPRGSTLFSLSVFISIDIALIILTFSSISQSEAIYWYHYLFLATLIPIGLIVLIKVLIGYKITIIGKSQIEVSYPVRLKKESYPVKDIIQWREEIIKTVSGVYKQLEIYFSNDKKLTLSKQEHSNYDRIISYLSKKAAKKRIQ